jgi:dTMP kinase
MKTPPPKNRKRRAPTLASVASETLSSDVVVPTWSAKRFYGAGIPGVQPDELQGRLIVIEGADGSGRSTQIARLVDWLEGTGHATTQVGLKRSTLVSGELDEAKRGNIVSQRTLSLFYATDFADQLENVILPGLRAGYIVLADRYIYTLMARDRVRGVESAWLKNLYGMALVPDAVFYLQVSPENLVQRNFAKDFGLDYWESGMDLGFSRDIFFSFVEYQKRIIATFQDMQREYGFTIVDGDRPPAQVQDQLQAGIRGVLVGNGK